mgnify:CR=1 FL=1
MKDELRHLNNGLEILSTMLDQERKAIGYDEYGYISEKYEDLNRVHCIIGYHIDWLETCSIKPVF